VEEHDRQPPEPDPVVARLERLEEQLAEFHRRSAHRESIIDRLHAENQEFRDGLRRVILEPVVTDLIRLHDSMAREAQRLAAEEPLAARMLESYADGIELAIERCGYEMFPAVIGEAYQSGRHGPAGTVPTRDPALDNTVAEPLSAGLLEIESGKVRRPARARLYRYEPPADDAIDLPLADVDQPIHPDPVGK
jgi:molecular chaperone GrpE (heat shock protein)